MKEQFDKRLVEKIKDSFLSHEEPLEPREWERFSQAYFNKPVQKRRWVHWPFWVSGLAASLLLVLVFWPFGERIEENVQTLTDSIIIKSKPFHGIEPLESPGIIQKEASGISEPKGPKTEAIKEKTYKIGREDHTGIVLGRDNKDDLLNVPFVSASQFLQESDLFALRSNSQQKLTSHQEGETGSKGAMELDQAKSMVDQWKNGDSKSEEKSGMENADNLKKFRLGLVLGPQAASNPESGMNLGGGIMSELSLSNRVKIDFGVTYAQQKLEPDNSNALPESMTLRAQNNAYTNNYMGSEYTLSYASLDIPINVKYKVLEKSQSNLFLITGLSSMVYLDQNTVETYSVQSNFAQAAHVNGALLFEPSIQEYKTKYSPESGQKKMDLGRMLNLSLGYEYQLSNGTFISLEPFYKIPLGDLTFANQQFSIGGMNLRVNFQFKK
ncbi:outer membrane beta-barrel protein [Echinicola jeungdonensis]|uniref:Outer membrane beta-barrel protein n=1 Tax=Echinicola jeungdonensis TaxID=709343 RepID=A0ABV5J3B9_9BACT|nr:outer membrane beta-barrel protein [Echinicola jeungdonensis]MDN3668561.1 outer membrane beta-barrel protein [Echinicola jeungdonensis]